MTSLLRRFVLAVSIATSLASAYGAWDFFMKQKGHIDDDDFYFLYGTAGALTAPARYRAMSTVFIAGQRAQEYPERFATNLELRRGYVFNYVLASAVYRVTAILTGGSEGALDPWSLRRGFLAAFLVAFGAVSWLVWRSGDPLLGLAYAATVTVCGYWATTATEAGDQRFVYLWLEHPTQLRTHIVNFFVNPRWYSFLHNSPRSTFVVVLIGVFVLRWTNRLAASYWCLLAAVLTHGSNGLMMTVFIMAIDIVSTPGFYTAAVLRPAAAALLVAVAAESVWPAVLFQGGMTTKVAAVVLLVVAAAAAWRYGRPGEARQRLSGWFDRRLRPLLTAIERPGRVLLDLLLLGALWALLFAVSVAVSKNSTDYQRLYFYQQANGRLLAILEPVLILGAVLWGLRLVTPRAPAIRAAIAGVLLLALCPVAVGTLRRGIKEQDKLMADLLRRVPVLEAQMQSPPMPNKNREMPIDELQLYVDYLFYYALARSLEAGTDYVSPLVSAPPQWGAGGSRP